MSSEREREREMDKARCTSAYAQRPNFLNVCGVPRRAVSGANGPLYSAIIVIVNSNNNSNNTSNGNSNSKHSNSTVTSSSNILSVCAAVPGARANWDASPRVSMARGAQQ